MSLPLARSCAVPVGAGRRQACHAVHAASPPWRSPCSGMAVAPSSIAVRRAAPPARCTPSSASLATAGEAQGPAAEAPSPVPGQEAPASTEQLLAFWASKGLAPYQAERLVRELERKGGVHITTAWLDGRLGALAAVLPGERSAMLSAAAVALPAGRRNPAATPPPGSCSCVRAPGCQSAAKRVRAPWPHGVPHFTQRANTYDARGVMRRAAFASGVRGGGRAGHG